MKINTAFAAIVLALAPAIAAPDVVDSAANGFTVKTTLHIKAPPRDVYHRMIRNIGDWWNPQHTFSGNSHSLSIEEKAMGCFCERLPNEGTVRHMEVVYLAPEKSLGMTGALGPLQTMAAAGSMRIEFTAEEGGTKLEVTYAVTGYLPAGMNTLAGMVDSVITEQFTRLKNYIERGQPVSKGT
jgi:uncharacterized protein YndB with AHSA1/START domain